MLKPVKHIEAIMTNRTKVFGTESSKITDSSAAILQELARVISRQGLVLCEITLKMNEIIDGRRNQPRTFTATFEIVHEITETNDGLSNAPEEKRQGLRAKAAPIISELTADQFLDGPSVKNVNPNRGQD